MQIIGFVNPEAPNRSYPAGFGLMKKSLFVYNFKFQLKPIGSVLVSLFAGCSFGKQFGTSTESFNQSIILSLSRSVTQETFLVLRRLKMGMQQCKCA